MKKTEKPLPGKIVVVDFMHHICRVYDNSDTAKRTFKIRNDNGVEYGDFTWLNCRDAFVGCEFISGKSRNDFKGNVVVFDVYGNIIETLYEAKPGVTAGLTHSSRTDKYLLFTTDTAGDFNKNPFEGLERMISIIIMDLPKKQVIKLVKDVGTIPAFEVHESPWLFDETAFVYSYKKNEDPRHDKVAEQDSSGIYICDVGTGQRKLLVADAYFAICSPTSLKIAYIKDQALRVMDLKTNDETVIYKGAPNERFKDIHWTPDGKCIYLASFHDYPFGFFSFDEKLLDVATREGIPFKKIDFGLGEYSWK